jgi:hypothetical protein
MNIKEFEASALKLIPKDRARLAEKLLESLQDLPEDENQNVWPEEVLLRDVPWTF